MRPVSVTVRIREQDVARVVFGVSPLAELTAALHVLAKPEHHPGHRDWVELTASRLSGHLAAEAAALAFLWRSYRAGFLLPGPAGPGRDLGDELADIDALSPARFAEEAAYPLRGGGPRRELAGLLDSPQAQERIRTYARARSAAEATTAEQLLTDPDGLRRRLRVFLESCADAFFDDEWARLRGALFADTQRRRELLARQGVYAALESLSPAAHADAAGERVVLDKVHHGVIDARVRPVHALPTAFGWPHLIVQDDASWPAYIQYPLPTGGPAVATPDLKVMERRLAALADPVRLRLCRSMAREARSTLELAAISGLGTPTVSRHLRALRLAGLVTTRRHGHFVLYELDIDAARRLGPDLLSALLR
jgi:DNA-binding transcriptional ArsR family regulator